MSCRGDFIKSPPHSRERKIKTSPSLPGIIHHRLLYSTICLNVFSYHFLPISLINFTSRFLTSSLSALFSLFAHLCSAIICPHLAFCPPPKWFFYLGHGLYLCVHFCLYLSVSLLPSACLYLLHLKADGYSLANTTHTSQSHTQTCVGAAVGGGRCETGEGDRVENENVSLLCLVIKYGLLWLSFLKLNILYAFPNSALIWTQCSKRSLLKLLVHYVT